MTLAKVQEVKITLDRLGGGGGGPKMLLKNLFQAREENYSEWALNIFSGSMIAAGNVRTDEEAKAIVDLAVDNLKVYFDSYVITGEIPDKDETIKAQNYYCPTPTTKSHT